MNYIPLLKSSRGNRNVENCICWDRGKIESVRRLYKNRAYISQNDLRHVNAVWV